MACPASNPEPSPASDPEPSPASDPEPNPQDSIDRWLDLRGNALRVADLRDSGHPSRGLRDSGLRESGHPSRGHPAIGLALRMQYALRIHRIRRVIITGTAAVRILIITGGGGVRPG